MEITLRDVRDADLPAFFAQTNDPEGIRMAAFTAKDPSDLAHFQAHWTRILEDPTCLVRTVVADDGEVIGHASVYGPPGEREVTYWIDRRHWGRGAATAALRALLALAPERPLHARAAADNAASVRVLTKCGFRPTGTERDFAHGRGEEVGEVLFTLPA
ncbi:GNAT family N-acetyltransferase [Streptomyces longispororuber]|uniref:GNAT family N-acetyltransferase n=1 Tax=Streptomyces longispororuber TaxID=68230 RepID=UPI002109F325|nr:GNAT family N-acetyltransferase [Streptomyces longispororuber]MCQ4209148.1 GNAT family N-acetyltransferase [Streptomyces longispororuber]